jgi:hypothetical protein
MFVRKMNINWVIQNPFPPENKKHFRMIGIQTTPDLFPLPRIIDLAQEGRENAFRQGRAPDRTPAGNLGSKLRLAD